MKTVTCHHCSANIEINSSTLQKLKKTLQFQCPHCLGFLPSSLVTSAAASDGQRPLNRNMLILGCATLLVLGGLGFFLASQKSGDTTTVNQNIRNEILNNTYFTQLIANGVTTKKDLEAIGDIRPYGDGFVGISLTDLARNNVSSLAARTGAVVFDVESADDSHNWLTRTFDLPTNFSAWVFTKGEVGLLTETGVISQTEKSGFHKVVLHWKSNAGIINIRSDSSTANSNGLVAYYSFNGNAEDASGNGRHAEVHGALPTEDIEGNPNSAYRFDGSAAFILAPVDINPENMPSMTMMAYAWADSDKPVQMLMSHDTSGFGRSVGIDFRGGGKGWSAFCGNGGVLGHEPVKTRKWNFVAVVYENEREMITLYANGRKISNPGALPKGMTNLTIGKNPAYPEYFNGVIDEVKIYNRALTESEIQEHYQAFSKLADSQNDETPQAYKGRKLSEIVDLESAAVWVDDEFDDPNTSGFAWAMKDQFKDGRITIDGMSKHLWGTTDHQFNNFAVEVVARTSRDKHLGWGLCICKHPIVRGTKGVEVLLDSEGMLSVVECRHNVLGQGGINPAGPVPVASFRKGEFNSLVATFSKGNKLAVFVNGSEACAPIVLPYILEPAMLQLSSVGGISLPARLEFESFKVFSLVEKQDPANAEIPQEPEPAMDSWVDTDGREIQARFLRLEGETLVIDFQQKETRVPLSRLSAESRSLAQQRHTESTR